MSKLDELEGYNLHRHENNPKEKELHDKFIERFASDGRVDLERIVFNMDDHDNPIQGYLSDREKRIIVSTIQWLGSPVGNGFLNSCGYELENKKNYD